MSVLCCGVAVMVIGFSFGCSPVAMWGLAEGPSHRLTVGAMWWHDVYTITFLFRFMLLNPALTYPNAHRVFVQSCCGCWLNCVFGSLGLCLYLYTEGDKSQVKVELLSNNNDSLLMIQVEVKVTINIMT